MKKIGLVFSLVLFLFVSIRVYAQSDIPNPYMWVTNFDVLAIATQGDFTYIGGRFDYIGPNTGSGAKLTTTSPVPDLDFPKVNGTILTIIPDANGGWYIGGNFSKVGTFERRCLAHIKPDYTVDSEWNPNANSNVYSIALSGNNVYVGGLFTSVGGESRNYVAKLNNTTGVADLNWNPNPDDKVSTITISENEIYIGGYFNAVGGETRNYIAKINGTSGVIDPNWNPNSNNRVNNLSVNGDYVYALGSFDSLGGEMIKYLARLDKISGTTDLNWNPDPDWYLNSIAFKNNDIFVGGSFNSIGGQNRFGIAKLNDITGAADPNWNIDALIEGTNIRTILLDGSFIYAAGYLDFSNGEPIGMCKINILTSLVEHSYNSITNGLVITLAINGSDIYAGGNFYSLGGLKRKNIARINNLTGAADPLWNPGANQDVNFIVADITGLYVGGTFDSIGSVNRKGIAKLEITTGAVDINWNPNPNSNIFFPFIKTMTIVGDDIYVGGHFTEIGGVGINSIAKINTSTGIVDPIWNPSATNYSICEFNSIAVSGENVFVSGDFTEIGGVNRFKLAKLDDVFGSIDVSWDPNPQNLAIIKSLVIDGNDIYIGGNFLGIAGAPINHIARVNKVTGIVDTDWNSNMDISSQVETIAIHGNNIYVGGFFSTVGGGII